MEKRKRNRKSEGIQKEKENGWIWWEEEDKEMQDNKRIKGRQKEKDINEKREGKKKINQEGRRREKDAR